MQRDGKKMSFKELLVCAKAGDERSKEEIFLMYRLLLFKETCICGTLDEDFFQEPSMTLLYCIRMFLFFRDDRRR